MKAVEGQIYTCHSQKQVNQNQESSKAQKQGAVVTQPDKPEVILLASCPTNSTVKCLEKAVRRKSQQLTLLHFTSSSITRFLYSLQDVCCELDVHGKPESHVSSCATYLACLQRWDRVVPHVQGEDCMQTVAGRKLSCGFITLLIPRYLV